MSIERASETSLITSGLLLEECDELVHGERYLPLGISLRQYHLTISHVGKARCNSEMNRAAIRRSRVRQLIDENYGGVDARFAAAIGKASTQVARWFMSGEKHKRNIGERLAREIESALDLPEFWLDRPEDANEEDTPQLTLPDQLSAGTAREVLKYVAQLSIAQQRELLKNLREAAEANDIVKTTLKIGRLDHPEDPRVADALKSASILRTEGRHREKKKHGKQRALPFTAKPKNDID